MSHNFTQHILVPSLELIRSDTKIKRFYFLPGLLSVIFLSVLLVYQVIYTYVELLWNTDKIFQILLDIFHSQYMYEIVVSSAIFLFFYVILLPIFEWALIRYVQDSQKNTPASRSDSFGLGIVRFWALFEYNNIFWMFKLTSILNGFLFSLRGLWLEYIGILSLVFFIAFLGSILLNIFTAYAKYEIVLENKGVFEAVGISSQIALLNMKVTGKLYLFMFLMNIKVVINFIVFLFFPLVAVFLAGVLTSQIFATIAFVILGILFLIFISILGYMAGVLDVFTTAIWYHAYMSGKEKLENIQK